MVEVGAVSLCVCVLLWCSVLSAPLSPWCLHDPVRVEMASQAFLFRDFIHVKSTSTGRIGVFQQQILRFPWI